MSVDIKVIEPAVVKDFPKIMINKSRDLIIAFRRSDCGTVLYSSRGLYTTFSNSTSWDTDKFEDFNGEITLKNN